MEVRDLAHDPAKRERFAGTIMRSYMLLYNENSGGADQVGF
jgi:hypothetical protein